MAITIDDIEALRRRLAELPRNQPRAVTKQEAVSLLASELGAARRRGYSPEDLAQLFTEHGLTINAATLRGYLRRKRKVRRASASTSPPFSAPGGTREGLGANGSAVGPPVPRIPAIGLSDARTMKPRTEPTTTGSSVARPTET